MSKFIKTTTVTKTEIVRVINGNGPGCARVSVAPDLDGGILLVVGANFEDKRASHFFKANLQALLNELQEVCDAMD